MAWLIVCRGEAVPTSQPDETQYTIAWLNVYFAIENSHQMTSADIDIEPLRTQLANLGDATGTRFPDE